MSEFDSQYQSLGDLTSSQDNTVSFNNFFTSSEEVSRAQRMEKAKQDKLSRLSKLNQHASLDDSYTDLGDGRIESNRNKIWNELNDQEIQSVLDYGVSNYGLTKDEQGNYTYGSGETYNGPTRRLYMFGTNESDKGVKFGVARGDLESSEARYTPDGTLGGYGWAPGEYGVDVNDKRMDVLLPDNVATMLEALGHGRSAALQNRSVKDRYEEADLAELYGSGVSEYYDSKEGLLGAPTEVDQTIGRELFTKYLTDIQRTRPSGGIIDKEADFERIREENRKWAADNAGLLDRVTNTIKSVPTSFVDSLIVSPLDAIGDMSGLYDLGSGDENTKAVNEFFGYNPLHSQRAIENIRKQWEIASDDKSSKTEAVRAIGNGILEAISTPEMWGTSMGTLMSWVIPGAVLSKVGVGTNFAKAVKGIDAELAAGKISEAAARSQKAKAFMTIDGAKAALVNQSGHMVSALGAVNKQYEEFVENNNGIELEDADKAEWFGTRFAIQMVNQNLDKIVDFKVMKSAGAIASLVPAVKGMTNKEFANVAKQMGKGVLVTAASMGSEAAQEYTQSMMEVFNSRYGSEKFSDLDTFVKFITDERNVTEAAVGAIAGAGGALQFEAVGTILPATAEAIVGAGKLADKIRESIPKPSTLPEEAAATVSIEAPASDALKEASKTVGKYANMFSDDEYVQLYAAEDSEEEKLTSPEALKASLTKNPEQYASAIEEIEKAEQVLQAKVDSGKVDETDDISFKLLRSSKREVYKALMADDKQPTLGSGISPEYVMEEFLDTVDEVDGELVLTDDEKQVVDKYAKANDLPPLRFTSFRKARGVQADTNKDAAAVYEESITDGPRSASSYRKKLKTLVNSPNPNKAAVKKVAEDMDKFLLSQENRKAAFDAALKELKADVANYNKNMKTVPASVKNKLKMGRNDIPGFPNAYIAVSEDNTGKLRVNAQSMAISDSLKDTISYLQRTKAVVGSKVLNITQGAYDVGTGEGINVRPNVSIAGREQDEAFYRTRKVTKVIVDPNAASKKWTEGSDYHADNESKVNTGEYTADDVVVINSTAKAFPKGGHIRKQLAAAYKAGATIVLDNDSTTRSNAYLKKLLSSYHYTAVEEDGISKYMPAAKAEEIKEENSKVAAAKAEKVSTLRQLMVAINTGDQETVDKITASDFDNDTTKVSDWYNNITNKETDKISKVLLDIAVVEGFESDALANAMVKASNDAKKGRLPTKAVTQAFTAVTARIKELEKGSETLAEWKQVVEDAKKGKGSVDTWLEGKENLKPMSVIQEVLGRAIGKDRKAVFTYYDKEKRDFVSPFKSDLDVPKDNDGNVSVPYQTIELDPNAYVTVSRTTPLNTLVVEELKVAGGDALQFNKMVEDAIKDLEAAIRKPNLDYKGKPTNIFDLANSPASTLVYDEDFNISPNVAVAMRIAMGNFSKNSKHLLKQGKKSKAEVAETLGIDQSQVTHEIMGMMADKGILYKTAADTVGKDVANLLGISRKSGSESDKQMYDALVADLGQTALLLGVEMGAIEQDNDLKAAKFAKVVLGKKNVDVQEANSGSGGEAKVIFIQSAPKGQEVLTALSEESKAIAEIFPESDVNRKEPKFKRMSRKEMKKAATKIRNEKLGLEVADESEKALINLMDTEWSADLAAVRDVIKNEELIKRLLGYIQPDLGSAEYEQLSYQEKDVQESINRGLDKAFEELRWLVDNHKDVDSVSLWFEYFFSKNGRFFVESNTINAQSGKHLDRFLTQPKSHINTYKVVNGKFTVNGEDVTSNVHYALAQAFGFATDKKDTVKIKEVATLVLSKLKTKKGIKQAKKEFLETGEFVLSYKKDDHGNKVPDKVIEIEHLGHALQGFDFLQKVATGKEFDSALTAEFDAVTSGFGLKLLQMPIVGKMLYDWLQKVGIILDTDEVMDNVENVSMNDILDSGGVRDSYQTLAADVKQYTFEEMHAEVVTMTGDKGFQAVVDTPYHRKVWKALTDPAVLPQVSPEGEVSKALRNIFKPPFMTFNYSASLKSIRSEALPDDMVSTLTSKMAKVDISNLEDPMVKFMEAVAGKGKVKSLQTAIRSKPLNEISIGKNGTSLDLMLRQMIEASYGAEVERILTEQFEPFVKAQNVVNGSFKAVFEVFAVEFHQKLEEARKNGKVTLEEERAIYDSLVDRWPAIKGPLSSMEEEYVRKGGVGIYDTQSASPYGSHSGRKPVRANLSEEMTKKMGGQKSVRVSHMVKELTAAIAAGSVVPIHYIDGAIMAKTINTLKGMGIDVVAIHDAIMVSLVHMDIAQQTYNSQMIEVGKSYSYINELHAALRNVIDNVPMTAKEYNEKKIQVQKKQVSIKELVNNNYKALTELANDVNQNRAALFETLNKGAKIMHMAGTPGGVYSIEPGTLDFTPVEEKSVKRYDEHIKVDGMSVDDLSSKSQNLC